MTARVKLSDVARHANVSTATVSRVLNGKSVVSEQTRRQVLAALDVLGYARPDSVSARSSGMVGLVVPELSNPIFPMYVQELERHLSTAGWVPLLCTQSPGGVTEDEYVRILTERGVAGIIFVSGLHADLNADPKRYHDLADIPFVTINGPNPAIAAPSFACDDADATNRALEHLVSLGHTRIGLAIGPSRFVPISTKVKTYTTALRRLLPESEPLVAQSLFTIEGGQACAEELLDSGVSAIIATSDLMAIGAIYQVRSRGLRVPEDVSVVGYDGTALTAFTDPPLTTVRQPVARIAQAAVTTLLQSIAGEKSPTSSLLFSPELIVRSSTAPKPQEKE
ncbi:MAG: LacI family DNA-binding transcriptional regulator [Actinomycetaceae bacterium]|nr:LacI family DNA-binding transcriptional regulator [Actinomycetaceae bacterium]